MKRTFVFTLLALAAGGAAAQQKPRPDPADQATRTPQSAYRSAFEGYRSFSDAEVARWREANEEMGRLNGHVGHVPGSVPPPSRGTDAPAKPAAHGSHK